MPAALAPASRVAAACGPAWGRVRSDALDAALSGLLAGTGQRRVAVVALGSYARRELCPGSDVDLLVLHDGLGAPVLAGLVHDLCYPLWDARVDVAQRVATPAEAVAAAATGVEEAAALIDRRLVAGDHGLLDALGGRVRSWLRRHGGGFLDDLARADAARHARAGAVPGRLEPHLKDGAGGLRDVHSLRWAAAALLGEGTLDALVGARYVGASDRRRLADAHATLLAARCGLHLVAGGDVLRLDLQDEVAAGAGWPDGLALLHDVGLAMRAIAHVHGRAWRLLLADARRGRRRPRPPPTRLAEGIVRVDGLVEIEPDRAQSAEPALALGAVAAAAQRGTHLGRRTAARLARDLQGVTLTWDEPTRQALVALLRCGADALPALSDADHAGLLEALLPGWPRVRGRPQRNPLHTFDLDTHGARTLAELGALAAEPRLAAVADGLADPDALLLAAWLHDVGKAWPGDHSVTGAEVVTRWLRHAGFAPERVRRVAHLVREHLLLPDAATRRDLDSEDEIVAVAERAGSVEAVDALYLLALADGRATGPSAGNPWREGLVAELHGRVRRVLADDAGGTEALPDPAAVVAEARRRARAGGLGPRDLDRLLDGLPRRYLLAASPAQCVVHARLLAAHERSAASQVAVEAGPPGTVVVSLVAADRAGLVADCAGALAAAGAVVHEARAFTRTTSQDASLALDWFVVRPGSDVDWRRLAGDLRAAAAGHLDVAGLVGRRERRRDARPPRLAAPVPVEVTVEPSGELVRIEVHAPDTPGLLWRLARALAGAGLDLAGARVATLGPAVRDVFFARPGPLPADLADRLRAVVDGPSPGHDSAVRSIPTMPHGPKKP